jgi:hypothetical protein
VMWFPHMACCYVYDSDRQGRVSLPHHMRNSHTEVCDPSYVLATNQHSIKERRSSSYQGRIYIPQNYAVLSSVINLIVEDTMGGCLDHSGLPC